MAAKDMTLYHNNIIIYLLNAETKILVASNSDIDVIPIAIAGIATAMIVLIVVAILAVVMMLILAASRRRMETNLSSHSDIFKSVWLYNTAC